MRKKLLTIIMALVSAISCALVFGGCSHKHELTKVPANSATCELAGNSEYYTCGCGKYFADEGATDELEENEWVIGAIGHNYQDAEWHDALNQHVKKQVCANDSTHIIETSYESIVHALTKVPAKSATCEVAGNSEYYTCACGKCFADEGATDELEENEWVIGAIGHNYQDAEWHDPLHQHVKKQVCLNDSTHILETNYVNATAETLDSIINAPSLANRNWESYKLSLAAGNYDKLVIDHANKINVGDGTANSPFVYRRIINSLELVGENRDTTIMAGLTFDTGLHVVYTNPAHYIYKTYAIDTLIIKNITFKDKVFIKSLIEATYYENATISINNIIFENVKFDMTDVEFANAALHIQSANKEIENITIRNCEFINCLGNNVTGITVDTRTTDDVNITIEDCKFNNISYNAIQLSGSGSCYVGRIIIRNNEIKNTGNRAIRISRIGVLGTSVGELIVENNIMINASDANGELLKCKVNEGATVVIDNNYWGASGSSTAIKGLVKDGDNTNILDTNPKSSAE